MIDRRELLKWSVIAPVIASGPVTAMAATPEGIDALVVDSRFGATQFAGISAPRRFTIDGDVTKLWYNTLDALWRKPGFTLGGITGSDALFVLERLAEDHGRRVVVRREVQPAVGDQVAAISWVIAPHHPSVKA